MARPKSKITAVKKTRDLNEEEAQDLIASGEICDAKTIMAVQYLQLMRK